MKAASLVRLCFPLPPTPTKSAFPLGDSRIRLMRQLNSSIQNVSLISVFFFFSLPGAFLYIFYSLRNCILNGMKNVTPRDMSAINPDLRWDLYKGHGWWKNSLVAIWTLSNSYSTCQVLLDRNHLRWRPGHLCNKERKGEGNTLHRCANDQEQNSRI